MPAGIMIEAGQADLLLISWMGVDAAQPRRARLPPARLRAHLPRQPLPRRATRCATTSTSTATPARATCGCSSSTTTAACAASPASPCATDRPASSPTRSSRARPASSGIPRRSRTAATARSTRRPSCARRAPSAATGCAPSPKGDPGTASAAASRRRARTSGRRRISDGPHAVPRRGRGLRPARRSLGARLPARRDAGHARRLVLRRPLQERPVHARHADVRGLPAGDGVLPRGARLHRRPRRLALRARSRASRT